MLLVWIFVLISGVNSPGVWFTFILFSPVLVLLLNYSSLHDCTVHLFELVFHFGMSAQIWLAVLVLLWSINSFGSHIAIPLRLYAFDILRCPYWVSLTNCLLIARIVLSLARIASAMRLRPGHSCACVLGSAWILRKFSFLLLQTHKSLVGRASGNVSNILQLIGWVRDGTLKRLADLSPLGVSGLVRVLLLFLKERIIDCSTIISILVLGFASASHFLHLAVCSRIWMVSWWINSIHTFINLVVSSWRERSSARADYLIEIIIRRRGSSTPREVDSIAGIGIVVRVVIDIRIDLKGSPVLL